MKNLQELIMGNDSDSVAVDARGLHDFWRLEKTSQLGLKT
ncbi:uncharacterized protein UCCLBBS124_1463 [Levilactobacillus brevis]|nr:uncharacterized protein UCCLBBS124_1431 [Levilactobacillus brevis]QCZ43787.1 uncharacterized protein UCCLBBS124_1463 [Levilactobacillus brevis]